MYGSVESYTMDVGLVLITCGGMSAMMLAYRTREAVASAMMLLHYHKCREAVAAGIVRTDPPVNSNWHCSLTNLSNAHSGQLR
jgi:hypothetical protein